MPLLKYFNRAKNNMELVASVTIPTPPTPMNPNLLGRGSIVLIPTQRTMMNHKQPVHISIAMHRSWLFSVKRLENLSRAIHGTSISLSVLLQLNKQLQTHAVKCVEDAFQKLYDRSFSQRNPPSGILIQVYPPNWVEEFTILPAARAELPKRCR